MMQFDPVTSIVGHAHYCLAGSITFVNETLRRTCRALSTLHTRARTHAASFDLSAAIIRSQVE